MSYNYREQRSALPGAASSRGFSGCRTGPLPLQEGRRAAPPIAGARSPTSKLGASPVVRAAGQALGTQQRRGRVDLFTCDDKRRHVPAASDLASSSRAIGSHPRDIDAGVRQRARSNSGNGACPPLNSAGSVGSAGELQAGHRQKDFPSPRSGPAFAGTSIVGGSPETPKVVTHPGLHEPGPDVDGKSRSLQRRLSCRSKQTLARLGQFQSQFNDVEASVQRIEQALHSEEVNPGHARDDLAQVEALLDKLQFNGVDCIDIFELDSGKEQCRQMRKDLTRRAEELHTRIEGVFGNIREAMSVAAAKPSSGGAPEKRACM